MICRKCGANIPDNAIRCSNCGIKVNMVCPECKTLNLFGTTYCTNCGFELIKICPNCKSSNIYSATECRKCKTPLVDKQNEEILEETTQPTSISEPDNEIIEYQPYTTNNKIEEEPLTSTDIVIQTDDIEEIEESNEEVIETFEEETSNNIDDEPEEKSHKKEEPEETEETPIFDENGFEITEQNENSNEEEEFIDDSENITDENSEEQDEEYIEDTQEEPLQEEENREEIIEQSQVQSEAVKKAIQIIKTSIDKHILAVTGSDGCGKSAVLKQTSQILASDGYLTLYGSSTPLSQITSFGFFQDAFLRIMGFPPFTNNNEAFIKDFKKSEFVKAFNFLDEQELNLFLNMLYPVYTDDFENILENKNLLFSILEKVLKSFLVSSNIIIAIDNFELLDGASYDFINHLLNKKFFNNRLKLFVAYQENKAIESYFNISLQNEKIFETICLEKLTNEELINSVNKLLNLNIEEILPEDILKEILIRADGNALRMEQEIVFLFDIGYIQVQNNEIIINEENKTYTEPQSLEELIKLRLNTLSPEAKNVLFMAAIMGYRFSSDILCSAVTTSDKKAERMIEHLNKELFINNVDNFTCEFKSLSIWKLIYQEAKADLLFKENSQRLYQVLKPLILSSNLQKLISCKDALTKKEEFSIWQDTANISIKLGDTNLFIISQKQSLKLLDELEEENSEKLKTEIYEQIGKLLSEKSPNEAIPYLANVLDAEIKVKNINKIIDIAGYFINSCYHCGNYFGANEAVDAILSILNNNTNVSLVDIALVQTRKLKAILNIGNSEQIINLVQEEILPQINKELEEKQQDAKYRTLLIDGWIISNIALAKALAIQGSKEVFNIIGEIKQFIENNDYKTLFFKTQIELTEALANALIGNIDYASEILDQITKRYKSKNMETNLLAEWNLVNIIIKVITKQTNNLKSDLFEIAAFCNNTNEHFTKNIIKLILGYILQEEGETEKALEIFNEEITYFAKEKLAIGALLSWALIVQISIDSNDIEKALNTATKALEIAQSTKINNFFFIIAFQKFLADVYMKKGDIIAVKMYLEKAIMLAKQCELKYQLAELYISYGKYMEQFMDMKQTYSDEYVKLTIDVYNKSVILAKELKIKPLIEKTTRERSAFKTFCQLKSIEL